MNRYVTRSIITASGLSTLIAVSACKKQIDPSAFDAGATAAPVVTAVAAPEVAPAAGDAAAPLASLAPAAVPPPAHVAAKPKKNLPECEEARKFCGHPALKTDKAIENLCTTKKQACVSKGGAL